MSGAPYLGIIYFHTKNHCFLTLPRSWKIQPSGKSLVTFSLERFESQQTIFSSWNGEYSENQRVGINRQWATSAGLHENEEIVFTLVPQLVKCFQVTLKPVSSEDWQVLHMNVTKVQNGLLDQLRVFWNGLVFPFYIHSNFAIFLQVISTNPVFIPLELCRTTEVHIVPQEEIGESSVAASSVASSALSPMATATGKPTSVADDSAIDLSKKVFEARLGGTIETSQTEVVLITNMIDRDFVASLQRNVMPSDAENFKATPESIGLLPDGCFPLKGDTICFVRVRVNPWSDNNQILCPLPLRKRLGLEDCCTVMITAFDDELKSIEKIILNPIMNPTLCPMAESSLEAILKQELRQSGSLILCPGTYLELENFGVIVNVEKPGWLQAEKSFTVTFGRVLSPHNIETSPVPVPVNQVGELNPQQRGLEAIGGYETVVHELIGAIRNACGVFADFGQSILLTAAEGVGKTHIIETVLAHLKRTDSIYWTTVPCSSQRGKRTETLVKGWQKTFREAQLRAPSAIFFDNLDSLCGVPSGHDASNGVDGQYLAKNCRALIDFVQKVQQKQKICLIMSAKSWSSLSDILTKTAGLHLFDTVIELRQPSVDERIAIFKVLACELNMKTDEDVLSEIGRRTEGFTSRDIRTLAHKLYVETIAENLTGTGPTTHVVDTVIKTVVPTALQGLTLSDRSDASSPDWESVGGLSEQKQILKKTFLWPTLYPNLMKQCPIRLVSGVLLYGMPGTGKTRLASCLALENKINFISVKGPELLSKFVGASELAVRDLFQRAKSAAPCVIFFDEFDSMAPRRGHDSTGVTDRCVNQLLTLLDGVETEGGVAVLAATSRPELIDPALLRPGRLDRCIECPLPQSADERKLILKSLSKAVAFEDEYDLDEIATATENFSGADLQALLFNAQLAAIQESVTNIVNGGDSNAAVSIIEDEFDFEGIHFSPSMDKGMTKLVKKERQFELTEKNKKILQLTQSLFETLSESDRNELKVLLKHAKQQPDKKSHSEVKLRHEHLRCALKSTRPSLSEAEINRFRKIYQTFRNGGVDPSAELKLKATFA